MAVTGPHGSGKATLLRLLGHVVFPQDGSIFIPSHLRVPPGGRCGDVGVVNLKKG